jgi:hypothetical protein
MYSNKNEEKNNLYILTISQTDWTIETIFHITTIKVYETSFKESTATLQIIPLLLSTQNSSLNFSGFLIDGKFSVFAI